MSVRPDTDYAWAAGFLDGEACFDARANRARSFKPRITASQIIREPLERLQDMFGGKIIFVTQNSNRSDTWRWSVQSRAEILNCIDLVYPYLVVKKKQAEILREIALLIRIRMGRPHKSELVDQPEILAKQLELTDRLIASRPKGGAYVGEA